jgi:hypothetical protein
LTITDTAHDIPPIFLSQDRFPRLQSINSRTRSWGDSSSLTWFPPPTAAVSSNQSSLYLAGRVEELFWDS